MFQNYAINMWHQHQSVKTTHTLLYSFILCEKPDNICTAHRSLRTIHRIYLSMPGNQLKTVIGESQNDVEVITSNAAPTDQYQVNTRGNIPRNKRLGIIS